MNAEVKAFAFTSAFIVHASSFMLRRSCFVVSRLVFFGVNFRVNE
jgi:hypothetical protein